MFSCREWDNTLKETSVSRQNDTVSWQEVYDWLLAPFGYLQFWFLCVSVCDEFSLFGWKTKKNGEFYLDYFSYKLYYCTWSTSCVRFDFQGCHLNLLPLIRQWCQRTYFQDDPFEHLFRPKSSDARIIYTIVVDWYTTVLIGSICISSASCTKRTHVPVHNTRWCCRCRGCRSPF